MTSREDIAAMRALADSREDTYRAHFDGCRNCPASPTGECARAQELYAAWITARELPAFRCLPD
ncbi:hypothetical protein ACH4S8_37935 [Streptomyces sp. NPDC021080]|uniref:hypothetical protein n=1 Tax=Streptomyces sp. NPDC021080 TaxID=3365110 RepID=UPI00379A2782